MNTKVFNISKRRVEFNAILQEKLGRRSEFEITIKAIKALYDFANGIKVAANINNQQLNQNAKDGLQYLQEIAQLIQEIKQAKEQLETDLDAIDATNYPEEPQP
jgi:uncharacterized protein YwgA